MNLKHDDRANAVIFGSGFLFLGIFFCLTAPDALFRGDVYVNGRPLTLPVKGVAKFKKAWEPTPEIVAHGKALFAQNCVTCHGEAGLGNGPAAAALNPKPRNFTADVGWKNGRHPAGVFKTLKEGIAGGGMASFATLPAEDRWSLAHYVISIGPNVVKDTNADLAAVGIADPTKEETGSDETPSIPVNRAMEFIANEEAASGTGSANVKAGVGQSDLSGYDRRLEAHTFAPSL
ncbi:MAG: cytochrome c [Cryobacterium sp.]|nr:cytochrome c [Oligoflexia bacterium]